MTIMHELELKFAVPSYTQNSLKKQIDTKTAHQQRLCAYYFDTPDQALAKVGIALRIRYENQQWVQTLKTAGDGIAKRIELNAALALTADPDTLDINTLKPNLALIDHPQVQQQLMHIMPSPQLTRALTIQYFTDVARTTRVVKKNNSSIEIAYDLGKV